MARTARLQDAHSHECVCCAPVTPLQSLVDMHVHPQTGLRHVACRQPSTSSGTLVQANARTGANSSCLPTGGHVPKRIWMYWDQGWEFADATCKAAARGWARLNPGWHLTMVNGSHASLSEHLPSDLVEGAKRVMATHRKRAHVSDFVRIALLATHGGVYADCDAFCGACPPPSACWHDSRT